jgi:hypothetical protein
MTNCNCKACDLESKKFNVPDALVDGLAYLLAFILLGPLPLFCFYVLEKQLTLLGWM